MDVTENKLRLPVIGQPAQSGGKLADIDMDITVSVNGQEVQQQQSKRKESTKVTRKVLAVAEGRVNVWLENASFDVCVAWLEDIGRRYGVTVEELSIDRAANAGMVNARITLVDTAGPATTASRCTSRCATPAAPAGRSSSSAAPRTADPPPAPARSRGPGPRDVRAPMLAICHGR